MSYCPHRLDHRLRDDGEVVEQALEFGWDALEDVVGDVDVRGGVSALQERLEQTLNHWEELFDEALVLWSAQISEQPDDDDVVVIGDELSIFRLLDAKDEDREEDVLHADVVWPPQSLLSHQEGKIDEGLLKFCARESRELRLQPCVPCIAWSELWWGTKPREPRRDEIEERLEDGADVLVLKGLSWGWGLGEPGEIAQYKALYSLLILRLAPRAPSARGRSPSGLLEAVAGLCLHDFGEETRADVVQYVSKLKGSYPSEEFSKETNGWALLALEPQFCQALDHLASVQQQPLHYLQLAWLQESPASTLSLLPLLPGDSEDEFSARHQIPHHLAEDLAMGLGHHARASLRVALPLLLGTSG